jgi:UDP-N-acetylmuramate--alanine ligase
LAAAALAHAAGASPEAILSGLREFRGLRRRLERKMGPAGATWLDDYAHHPTEVRAALAAARELCPRGQIWCVFQPHQASRTARLLAEFAESLRNADKIAIAEVFRAREGPPRLGEARAEDLTAEVRKRGGEVSAARDEEDIRAWLADAVARGALTPDDILITMSAGNLGSIGHGFSDWTGKIRQAG